ncbi:probable low-specificity L-threonine aldolase 1 isoform X1 [Cervus elaphus]|uniref:probable low-specificity L-threonine aldolase 1 isoform X1 n=1 Tax=Cervus elaphus TaxID=9860 RepID=UPI001CC31BB1|nr:probable low-specificity L-threonine aldolase 1 isoform X1 [Cervus elaphus]
MLRRLARAATPRHRVFWARRSGSLAEVPTYVVDLRSDTVTKPGPAMRRAMAEAVVGDDDYGEDPTVRELQATAAELLGVEQTLFVPTNTMANLISVMCHCRRRGSQLLLGQECHLHVYEQGGVAQIAGVHSHPLPDLPYGTLDLTELERLVTRSLGSPYHLVCELICLENTHSSSGGRVLPLEYLRQVHLLARSHGVRVHLDGARLMNAAVALGVPPARIVEHCDSVSLCFSKGLGAPVGALVGGPKDFIEEAWRLRKALGGGMRQAGVLAAAALVGLADAEEMLQKDHQNAQRFAKGIGVPRLLRGSHRRGDQHGDGKSGRAAARGAVPAPAGRELGRGGPDRPRGARAGLPLDGAVGARRVAPGRLRAGHRAGAGKVGVRAEDPPPWPGWTELTRAGVSSEPAEGEAVKPHPRPLLVSWDPLTSVTRAVMPSTCSFSRPHVLLCLGWGPKLAGTDGTPATARGA